MKRFALTDYDKTVLLVIFGLTILVAGGSLFVAAMGWISHELAFQIDLMAFGWWVGAIMTYGYERIVLNKR